MADAAITKPEATLGLPSRPGLAVALAPAFPFSAHTRTSPLESSTLLSYGARACEQVEDSHSIMALVTQLRTEDRHAIRDILLPCKLGCFGLVFAVVASSMDVPSLEAAGGHDLLSPCR